MPISWWASRCRSKVGSLRANGFFERGRKSLYWRDVGGKVKLDEPFHLTFIEADNAFL
jgi:hypothetical protein